MARKLVRIRAKNQITLPADVVSYLNVREDDYVQVEVTPQGVAQIAPARLAVLGTPEAAEANRRAEEDFKAGRVLRFENADAFSKFLLGDAAEQNHEDPPPSPASAPTFAELQKQYEEVERRIIEAALSCESGNKARAAKRLGWKPGQLSTKIKLLRLDRDLVR